MFTELDSWSDKDLEAELEERKKKTMRPPDVLDPPDCALLRQAVIDYVEDSLDEGREVKDGEHYIYEAAMEAIYGTSFWAWWNELPFNK